MEKMISVSVGFDVNGFAVNSRLSLMEDDFFLSDVFLQTVKKLMMNYDLTVVRIDEFEIDGNNLATKNSFSYGAKEEEGEVVFQEFADDALNDIVQVCESYEQAVDMVIENIKQIIDKAEKKSIFKVVK